MTILEATRFATAYLAERNLRAPRQDAELILLGILNRQRSFLLANPDYELSAREEKIFHEWLLKRGEHYPLQYLRGSQEFYGRAYEVTAGVLIPRPETEILVDASLELLQNTEVERLFVLDIGTGSGCIAVTLACELPRLELTATDVSTDALQCSRRNAERFGCLHRIEFLQGDVLDPVAGRESCYHLVVSNPPYVGFQSREQVDQSVQEYEPSEAVFAGESGLEIYWKLFAGGRNVLRPGGRLIVELGYGIQEQVEDLAKGKGWELEKMLKDLAGIDRCAIFH